ASRGHGSDRGSWRRRLTLTCRPSPLQSGPDRRDGAPRVREIVPRTVRASHGGPPVAGGQLRGWLELVPRALLRLAATRLPADQRQSIYNEEWLPELVHYLREAEGRPITRLIFGIRYAADMARGAGEVGRQLDGIRGQEQEAHVFISDGDIGNATESEDVYRDGYGPIAP